MLILLLIMIPLGGAIALYFIHQMRPQYKYDWLFVISLTSINWLTNWGLGTVTPLTFIISNWKNSSVFNTSPFLLFDTHSYIFTLVFSTLLLVAVSSAIFSIQKIHWRYWVIIFALSALGQSAILAGTASTLAISLIIADIISLILLLPRFQTPESRRKVYIYFAINLIGILAFFFIQLISGQSENEISFRAIIALPIAPYLLPGLALRLFSVLFMADFLRQLSLPRSLTNFLTLIPTLANLAILVRIATIMPAIMHPIWAILLITIVTSYGVFQWLRAENYHIALEYWLLGYIGIVFTAVLLANPAASISWAVSAMLISGLLFFQTKRTTISWILTLIGGISLIGLPFTPSANGWAMLSSENWILWLFYIPFISILIANYFKHTIYKPSTEAQTTESWMNYVYIGGFIWLLITQWGITYLLLPAPERINWLVVIITIIVSLGIGIALIYYPTVVKSTLAKFPQFPQISPPPQTNLQRARRGVKLFSRLLESESGLLWAILITLFIVSVLLQIGGGTP